MSKFFARGDSDSESDGSADDESIEVAPVRKATGGRAAVIDSDSDSEDEKKRVVKSHKDKAWDSMTEGIGKIKNSMKNNDWSVIYDEFIKVNALLDKAKAKNGVPKFYIKMLTDVNDHVNVSIKDKEAVKKMKKPTAHALNQMKLAIRKQCDKYRAEVDHCKEHPLEYVEVPAVKHSPFKNKADSSDDDSDEDDDDDDVSKSSSL